MPLAQQLIDSFARIVRANGGAISILAADGDKIRLGYSPGVDEECTTGQCVLPHLELQEMMREWLSRRAPGATVSVQLMKNSDA